MKTSSYDSVDDEGNDDFSNDDVSVNDINVRNDVSVRDDVSVKDDVTVSCINVVFDMCKVKSSIEPKSVIETASNAPDNSVHDSIVSTDYSYSTAYSSMEQLAMNFTSLNQEATPTYHRERNQLSYQDVIAEASPQELMEIVEKRIENVAERWSDSFSQISAGPIEDVEVITSDTEQAMIPCDPVSEMYYTASSEVSLTSDADVQDKAQTEEEDKDDRKNVMAGHVAAMRERFESMTRTNTPCPDLARSISPSLDVFRNTTPDRLG